MMRRQELTIKNIMTKTKVKTLFCNVLRNDALKHLQTSGQQSYFKSNYEKRISQTLEWWSYFAS